MGQTDGTSEPEEAVLAGKEALVVRTQEDSLLLFLSCAAGLHGLGTDFYPLLHHTYLTDGYSSPSTDSIIIVKDYRAYKGWPVSRIFRHALLGPHPPPPPHITFLCFELEQIRDHFAS